MNERTNGPTREDGSGRKERIIDTGGVATGLVEVRRTAGRWHEMEVMDRMPSSTVLKRAGEGGVMLWFASSNDGDREEEMVTVGLVEVRRSPKPNGSTI
jgi:hypothetical protein